MAQIYLARMDGMASFERHVVLKTILANRANDRRFINMFLDEAKLAATLNHQNIAQVYEVDQADGSYYMAMEYVHGENCRAILETSIRRGTVIPVELAVLIVSGAAAGLHHAHERKGKSGQALNIVHRDVSPANIMVGYDGGVKVLDFGIAKAEERYTQTIGSTIKGKYGYMSPEQCKGKAIDRRSDIFALGIVLYELTTQRRAFKGRDDFDTMKRIVAGDLVLPSSLTPHYPSELEGIILKALASEPDERYSTAQDMIEALDGFTQRAKLACTNTAMARFMVQLFGEPREPWETSPDLRRGTQPSSPGPAGGSSAAMTAPGYGRSGAGAGGAGAEEELLVPDDLPTTVGNMGAIGSSSSGGSATLPPSSALIPPRTITSPVSSSFGQRSRSASPTASAIVRTRGTGAPSGGHSQPVQAAAPALGSTPPPTRSAGSTTPPPMRSSGSTTPPPMRSAGSTTPPPLRNGSATAPPPLGRATPSDQAGMSGVAAGTGVDPSQRLPNTTAPMGAMARAGGSGQQRPWNEVSEVRGHGSAPELLPGDPRGYGVEAPSVPAARAAAPMAPLMRPTPSAPLSVPLVPRTFTPAALPPPPLGPLLSRGPAAAANAAGSMPPGAEGSSSRASSEDGQLRAQSSVMALLPRSADSQAMAPLPRPDTLAPDAVEQRFKYRWAIVVVLLVVLAAVGLMIAIALTSAPAT